MENIQQFLNSINIDSQLIIHILIAILIFNLFFLLKDKLSYLIIKLFKIKTKDKKVITTNPWYKPLRLFFIAFGLYIALLIVQLPPHILQMITKLFKCICIFLIAMGLANCISPKSALFAKFQHGIGKEDKIASLLFKVIKAIIYVFAFVIIISELGYNINGLIAGLGLGGLTIALAAQDAAKNLFGGLIILFDKPFAVGDWIQTSTIEGTVEDITFRSTRIRTLKDCIIVIPNSTLANDSIINWSLINNRRIDINLTLEFTNSLKNVCQFSNDIENMLLQHADVLKDSISVHFNEIKDSGYAIFIYCYINYQSYKDYLDVKENINYKVMQVVEKDKITLAYPTQTITIKK